MNLNSAIIGIILACLTAANLFFYEKVVKKGSYMLICLGAGFYYILVGILLLIFQKQNKNETVTFLKDSNNLINYFLYILTMSFSYVWFYLTKIKNVEISSLYDVLYIPILILSGIILSNKKIDLNFIFASILIIAGVILLSRE